LCFNCLCTGHSSKDCKSGSCRQCNSPHHTLLHHPQGSAAESPSSGSAAVVSNHFASEATTVTQVLLSTAMVKVENSRGQPQWCRALLDSASQASFITEACDRRLGLKRAYVNVPIHGLGSTGNGVSRGSVQCKIS